MQYSVGSVLLLLVLGLYAVVAQQEDAHEASVVEIEGARDLQGCPAPIAFQNCVAASQHYCENSSFGSQWCHWCHETGECIPSPNENQCHTWQDDFSHCEGYFYCPHDSQSFNKCQIRKSEFECTGDFYGENNCFWCGNYCYPGTIHICGHHSWYKDCHGYKPLPPKCPQLDWLRDCPKFTTQSLCQHNSQFCTWCHGCKTCNAYFGSASKSQVCAKKGQWLYYQHCLSCYDHPPAVSSSEPEVEEEPEP